MDSTIPHPKPHLTLTCYLKLLTHIPLSLGLNISYFQNVAKLIRDVLILCYIIAQYYLFDQSIFYRLISFEIFAALTLPLVLEGWTANISNYLFYLIRFYSIYISLFINQLLLHESRVSQTIFFLALIEIPSMLYRRTDSYLPEIHWNSHIFKLVEISNSKVAILQCTRKNSGETNQIELAIAFLKQTPQGIKWITQLRTAVSPNTNDLNFISESNILVTSCCSEILIYDAKTLQLLKNHVQPRAFKRLSFLPHQNLFACLKKLNNEQTLLSVYNSIFNTLIMQRAIPLEAQPEIIRFVKCKTHLGNFSKYNFMCVPSDRLNCLIIVDISTQETEDVQIAKQISQNELPIKYKESSQGQSTLQLCNQKEVDSPQTFEEEQWESENLSDLFWKEYIPKILKRFTSQDQQNYEINLYEYLNSEIEEEETFNHDVKEYVIDQSAIKEILVYKQLLVISCSENIIFFDFKKRKIVKHISTLSFDSIVHWIKVTPEYTYLLVSNEIKAWMIQQSNIDHTLNVIGHYFFYGIQHVIENTKGNQLFVMYNNALYKQKAAVINLP